MRDFYPERLTERYKIENFEELEPYEILELIGKKRGMIMRGGVVDTERASVMLRRCRYWHRLAVAFNNFSKRKKIIAAAKLYIASHNVDLQPRFDVAEVFVEKNQVAKINLITNAFDGEGKWILLISIATP